MRKSVIIFVFMLLCSMAFAQNKMHFISETPINKGNIVLNVGYEKQPRNNLRGEAPKICFNAGYGFTNWCVAGLYADFGRSFSYEATSISGKNETGQVVDVYSLEYHSNYFAYGLHAELHPLVPLMPGFYLFDVYALVRAGMHHYICSIVSEEGYDPFQERVEGSLKNAGQLYIAGGWGVAINPLKHFGFFYEGTYSTLNNIYPTSSGPLKKHLYHRFGLNIRFGGPKKWQG